MVVEVITPKCDRVEDRGLSGDITEMSGWCNVDIVFGSGAAGALVRLRTAGRLMTYSGRGLPDRLCNIEQQTV